MSSLNFKNVNEKQLNKWKKTIAKKYEKIDESKEVQFASANGPDDLSLIYVKLKVNQGFHNHQTYILSFQTIYEVGSKTLMYPFNPPKVKFLSKVWHSNVYGNGDICVSILKDEYSPQFNFDHIMKLICNLLEDANPQSAANGQAGQMEKKRNAEYQAWVKANPQSTEEERDNMKLHIYKDYVAKIDENTTYNLSVYKQYEHYFN